MDNVNRKLEMERTSLSMSRVLFHHRSTAWKGTHSQIPCILSNKCKGCGFLIDLKCFCWPLFCPKWSPSWVQQEYSLCFSYSNGKGNLLWERIYSGEKITNVYYGGCKHSMSILSLQHYRNTHNLGVQCHKPVMLHINFSIHYHTNKGYHVRSDI